jgi:ubiquitin carboxyl-terminal hydrolase 25/28
LRNLFHDLIVTENSAVTPERDLAYLALVSLKDEAERRVSVSDGSGRPIIDLSNTDEDKMDIDPPGSISLDVDDGASEATLVNEPQDDDHMLVDLGKGEPEDKENVPPVTDDSPGTLSPGRSPVIDVDMDAKGNQPESAVQGPPTPPPEMPDRAPPSIPPRPAARRNTVSSDINLMFGRQQDVTECIGNVMFQLEAALKPEKIDDNGEQIDLIKHLFYGKTKQTLSFPNSMESRTKIELFSHLLVNVAEGSRDLYSALDSSFDIEQVDLDGHEARRYLSISEIPPVLQIQVQRVQFDREKASAYKSNAFLEYPETLFMDRYMDDPDLKERREQTWKLKDELRSLLKRKDELTKNSVRTRCADADRSIAKVSQVGVDVPEVLDTLADFMEDIKDLQMEEDGLRTDPALPAALNHRSAAIRMALNSKQSPLMLLHLVIGLTTPVAIKIETAALESKIKEAFTDKRKHGYRIHSVFIHRGMSSLYFACRKQLIEYRLC